MGLTNTHTACGFSDLYHVFAPNRCILCITSWLPYITLCYISLGFFLPLEQPSTALLASAQQPCVFTRLLVANNSHRLSDVSQKIMYSKRKTDNFQSLLNTLLLFQNIQKYYLIQLQVITNLDEIAFNSLWIALTLLLLLITKEEISNLHPF